MWEGATELASVSQPSEKEEGASPQLFEVRNWRKQLRWRSGLKGAKDCQVTVILWENKKKVFSMLAVLRFLFFNVALSTTDVGTDFFTFLESLVNNPQWACLTLVWTVMPFLVRTAFFLYKKATGESKACATFTEEMNEFYKEAGCHLPFVSSLHNIWTTSAQIRDRQVRDEGSQRD